MIIIGVCVFMWMELLLKNYKKGENMVENRLILKEKELKDPISKVLGISGENEQEMLIFSFEDGFVDGTCNLDIEFPNRKERLY